MINFFKAKLFYISLVAIILAELLSLAGYFSSPLKIAGFCLITLLAFVLSMIRLEYGVMVVAAELIIGSKGHLFGLPISLDNEIAVRIAIFSVIFFAWTIKLVPQVISFFKSKKAIQIDFLSSKFAKNYLYLFGIILIAIIVGFLNNNGLKNIFLDFNNWLFFLFVFPLYAAIKTREQLSRVITVIMAAVTAHLLKVIAVIYIMSHKVFGYEVLYSFYRWIRTTGVGEVTELNQNFYRVFFQSQIYILIFVFILAVFIVNFFHLRHRAKVADLALDKPLKVISKKNIWFFTVLTGVWLSWIVSFSRSFWLATFVTCLAALIYLLVKKIPFKVICQTLGISIASFICALGLIYITSSFPLPLTQGTFSLDLLSKRMQDLGSEAAAATRWNMLPILLQNIMKGPVVGYGFGKTLTYNSLDPRVLAINASGNYTTFAFEWGYLELLLKLGIFGLVVYLWLLIKLLKQLFGQAKHYLLERNFFEYSLILGLGFGLVALLATHAFTPYLNHPLGIAYIMFTTLVSDILLKDSNKAV